MTQEGNLNQILALEIPANVCTKGLTNGPMEIPLIERINEQRWKRNKLVVERNNIAIHSQTQVQVCLDLVG